MIRNFIASRVLFAAALAVTFAGCATTSTSSAPSGPPPPPVTLEFKGKPGEVNETRYYSNSRVLSYQQDQIVRDRTDGVDFTVKSHVTSFDPVKKILKYDAKTVRKDGTVELHDLAFPELNEEIDYVIRSSGEILKAGRFPRHSLFFVPGLPIPDHPVTVGDTWTLEHSWLSAKDGIPLQLEVVAIFKDLVKCDNGKLCADLELSGHVKLSTPPTVQGSRFSSRLWGRMLFSVERGDVVWSEMRSREEMSVQGDRMLVTSCMISETKLSASFKTKFACEPNELPVTKVPKL